MIRRCSTDNVKFDDLYELDKKLGEGNFAIVHRAVRRTNHTGDDVAVKIVDKYSEDLSDDVETMLDALWNEVKILERVLHPHVLRTYEVYDLETKVFIVMEYCTGGEFLEKVKKTGKPFGLQETAEVALAVLSALSFLHFKGICHRDLKPENLLRDCMGQLKVADFGLANTFKAAKAGWFQKRMHGKAGTPGYMAPEVCSKGDYTEKCDIWSLGVIAFYALSGGSLPFPISDENELGAPLDSEEVSRLQIPKCGSDASQNFVHTLLQHDPQKRPSALAAVKLHFVKQILDKEVAEQKAHKSILSNELLKDLWDYVNAPPLTQMLGLVAARHLHITRVPAIAIVRRGFLFLDPDRDGFVPVKTLLYEMEHAPFHTRPDALQAAKKCFEAYGKALGSKPGYVDYSLFLGTEAVKHRHSMEAACEIIKDKPDGITIKAIQELGRRRSEVDPTFHILPKELQGRGEDSELKIPEVLEIAAVFVRRSRLQDPKQAPSRPSKGYAPTGFVSDFCRTPKPTRCRCCQRARVRPG